ncbi:MAG TPA: hypothetical protein DCZ03_02060 [Gammaproteobacteria bacterium]|nr:hypothetical protein [Gammaproteobacteria bacterium]
MNNIYKKAYPLLLAGNLMLIANQPMAESNTNSSTSIIDIYEQSLIYDAKLKAAQATLEAKLTIGAKSRAIVMPQLNLVGNTTLNDIEIERESSASPSPTGFDINSIFKNELRYNSNAVTLSLSQPINFQAIYLMSQAGALQQQARLEYQLAEQDLLFRVGKAYLEYLIIQDELKLANAERDAIEEQKNKAEAAFEVGAASVTDKHEAQAAYDLIAARLVAIETNLQNKYYEIADLVGTEPGDIPSFEGELDLDAPAMQVPSAEELVTVAQKANGQLNLARIGHHVAKKEVARLRAKRLPVISLNASYTESSENDSAFGSPSDSDATLYSINGQLPLFTGGLRSAEIKEAIGNREAAHQNVVHLGRTIPRQVKEAARNLQTTRRQVSAFRRSLRSAELLLASTELGFEVGQRTAGDVLAAQQRLYGAQTNHAQAQYQYLLQLLGISLTIGTLSKQDLELVDHILTPKENS